METDRILVIRDSENDFLSPLQLDELESVVF